MKANILAKAYGVDYYADVDDKPFRMVTRPRICVEFESQFGRENMLVGNGWKSLEFVYGEFFGR